MRHSDPILKCIPYIACYWLDHNVDVGLDAIPDECQIFALLKAV